MKKLFSIWKPDRNFLLEDARKISLALIIAGLLGLFLQEVVPAGAVSVFLVGLALWAYAIKKR
ncbi:MAG: hypothetical protein OXD47_08440 [Gammaproteobacteria bacterium]|nr:hypothetical protein [Gammaproteobacteria bacterium]MCY4211608.1 hypothetical protein [Gammaproteobacteria bacterium]MCY4282407.1 hypothetical protein [Gammaproteobacteria bacterium]MCY4338810.1 hypothetical protein [Gammaproteobacteria bacterium]